jgi:hypothetical protein
VYVSGVQVTHIEQVPAGGGRPAAAKGKAPARPARP